MSKTTLRQRVRQLLLGEDEKALNKAGFTYKSGALTSEGRKVVLDEIFNSDEALKAKLVEVAKQLNEDECKAKKKT